MSEIEQATAILDRSSLLTLTGPGGVGKTRVGLRLARMLLARFDDGVWLVECGCMTDPDLAAAGGRQRHRPDRADRTDRSCRPSWTTSRASACMLVLDDCDRVLGECAELAEALVRACSSVRDRGHQPRGAGRARRGRPADRVAG